jgi:hypothetical protein
MHDWTRVNAGIFHHFHQKWIGMISDALNDGRWPPDYDALAEQIAGEFGPDVLALEAAPANGPPSGGEAAQPVGELSGAIAVAVAPPKVHLTATIELAEYALKQNTVVARHSSGDRIVALVEVVSPGNKASRHGVRTFVEKAAAVSDVLPDMPLFLRPGFYVQVPLEATYHTAYQSVPQRWRRVLEAPASWILRFAIWAAFVVFSSQIEKQSPSAATAAPENCAM